MTISLAFLRKHLSHSTTAERKIWANQLVIDEHELSELFPLLFENPKTCSRFLWLLSDVGIKRPSTLLAILPELLTLREKINYKTEPSFANYWLIAGVPEENEGEVFDLLILWVSNPKVDKSAKVRSIKVLRKLCHKHPELIEEVNSVMTFLKA